MLILTRFLTLGAILIAGSALIALFGIAGLPHWIESWFRTRSAWIPRLLWIAVGVFVVYFGLFAIFRHYNLGTTTLDMGNVEQAVWNTAHGAPFRMTTDPEYGYPLAPRTGDLPATAACQDRVALILSVEDVDAAFAALCGRGADFVTAPHDRSGWGIRVAHLRDPDGNLLELYEPLEEA